MSVAELSVLAVDSEVGTRFECGTIANMQECRHSCPPRTQQLKLKGSLTVDVLHIDLSFEPDQLLAGGEHAGIRGQHQRRPTCDYRLSLLHHY